MFDGDPDSGLYYYEARWYSPYMGRFLSPDPALLIDGMHLYRYLGNDPVNFSDPSGLSRQSNSAKMSEKEQEAANEKDESICRIVKTQECWASARTRRGRRAAGQPVPPPNLQTGVRGNWSPLDVGIAAGIAATVGAVACAILEPCGAAVVGGLAVGGSAAVLAQ